MPRLASTAELPSWVRANRVLVVFLVLKIAQRAVKARSTPKPTWWLVDAPKVATASSDWPGP